MSRTYSIWVGMRKRCFNPSAHNFAYYGGRGVVVCERWSEFAHFLADMGEAPAGMSLDRINVDGPYSPENCRWASKIEQAREKRRPIEFNGVRLTLAEWAARIPLHPSALDRRLRAGVPIAIALTKPSRRGRK
jgi:hypothetical protein